jgi:protein-S-isoprenylcysteine O-methyltransferase Ste14
MYLGMAVLCARLTTRFWSPLAGPFLVLIVATMNFVLIPREEAYLTRRFGDEYAAFTREVHQWLGARSRRSPCPIMTARTRAQCAAFFP